MSRRHFLLIFLVSMLTAMALAAPPKVLMVVTSAAELGGHPTGLWLEEFAVPYQALRKAGYSVVVASPQGGAAPLDPRSLRDFEDWNSENFSEARQALAITVALAGLRAEEFEGMFLSGGHGTVVDFPKNRDLHELIRGSLASRRPVAAVCHGPVALTAVHNLRGEPIVAGYRVTGFSDSEEKKATLGAHVPFLLETRLKELGGRYEKGPDFQAFAVRDRLLVTGQNPASSQLTVEALVQAMKEARSLRESLEPIRKRL